MIKKLKRGLSLPLAIAMVFTMLAASPAIFKAQAADAQVIPGQIEAENYTSVTGFSGTFTENTSDVGGGLNVGWTAAGNSLSYLVNVQKAGSYQVDFRVAGTSAATGAISLKDGSGKVLCTVDTPNTGGWQNWTTVTGYVDLAAGQQTLTLYCNASGFNINWFSFLSQTVVAEPTAAPGAGTYATGMQVDLASKTPNTQIYYTLDGSNPTTGSYLYTSPISVSVNTTIKAIGVKAGLENSDVATFSYAFDSTMAPVSEPAASKASGTYGGTQSVTISSATSGAKIYYTTDGSTPTTSSTLYTSAISVTSSMTIKAIAVKPGFYNSSVVQYDYVITAVAPTSTIPSGVTVGSVTKIDLTSATSGAVIYYTTDGTNPNTSSNKYNAPIEITDSIIDKNTNTITIKAYTAKSGLLDSAVTTLTYTFDPNFTVLTGDSTIDKVISEMTLQEKATLLVGESSSDVSGAAGATRAIPRLGIPKIVVADGPAGLRISSTRTGSTSTYYTTAIPVGTALASSWDTALVKKVGTEVVGNEVYKYGVDGWLAPGMNIQRNPLNGRNFEYYSEDPLVTGKMAAAMVSGVESKGVGTTIKHFAANNQETDRGNVNEAISERALREIYLRGFEIAVKEAQPWSVMSSYNKINGTYTSESKDLLTTILKNEWGYKGFVMTDWGGGSDRVAQVNAGNDLIMSGSTSYIPIITNGVTNGQIDINQVNSNVKRILEEIIKTPEFKGYKPENNPDLTADSQVSRQAATECMVLLKNDGNTLPLANANTIAPFGRTSYNPIKGGTGSGDVNVSHIVKFTDGIKNTGRTILDTSTLYSESNEMVISADQAVQYAANSDAAIITIGRNSGEGSDRKAVKGDYYLSDAEVAMIDTVSKAYHAANKKVVVVLNIGGVIEVASWRDKVDAILLAWQPGQECGDAIADVVFGKVNPSGKLAQTFPMDYTDVPSSNSFGTSPVTYNDDIYVGYRYYDTFGIKPAYEFGYGLSYTTFEYSNLKLSSNKFTGKITATVDVKNTGIVAGKEAVQMYISAPSSKIDKPIQELKAFDKTKLLSPGETQTVAFEIDSRTLASFDENQEAWFAEAGDYQVRIGASSREIKQTKTFRLDKDLVVEKVDKALTPQSTIKALKSVSINSISQSIASYKNSQEIDASLASTLTNNLDQAQQQIDINCPALAVKHMEDFVKHLNDIASGNKISTSAKDALNADVNALIKTWSGMIQE